MEISFGPSTALEVRKPFEIVDATWKRQAELILSIAAAITEIHSREDYNRAVEIARTLQAAMAATEERYRPIKRAIDEEKNGVLEMERNELETLRAARDTLGRLTLEYDRQRAAEAAAWVEAERQKIQSSGGLPAPVIVQVEQPKTRGRVVRTLWRARVENFSQLVRAVADGKVPLAALQADESWLNKQADRDREAMSVPGVRAYSEEKVHFRK